MKYDVMSLKAGRRVQLQLVRGIAAPSICKRHATPLLFRGCADCDRELERLGSNTAV